MAEPTRTELSAALFEAERERAKLQSALYLAEAAHKKAAGYVEELVAAALPDAESQALAGCVAALEHLRTQAAPTAAQRHYGETPTTTAVRRILVSLADRYGVAPVVCPPGFVVHLEPAPDPGPVHGASWSPGYEEARFEVRPVR